MKGHAVKPDHSRSNITPGERDASAPQVILEHERELCFRLAEEAPAAGIGREIITREAEELSGPEGRQYVAPRRNIVGQFSSDAPRMGPFR
jgi:hypothetical protein